MITRGALEALTKEDVAQGLGRHRLGDNWGTLGKEDKEANDVAAREGYRPVNVYYSGEQRFYVITE